MVNIPPEIQIRSTIKSGSVYYFSNESFLSKEPHYFIVINKNPVANPILLVCASSQIESIKKRRYNIHPDTLVELNKDDYAEFTRSSIIDCNMVFQITIEQIIKKLAESKLKTKPEINIKVIQKLREAVYCSPLVAPELKNLII